MKDVESASTHWLKQPINLPFAPTLERVLYAALLMLGGAIRFQDLAARPLSSQESIGAWAAWLVAQGLEDRLPLSIGAATDGVLLGALQWITFWLVGASDSLARLFPALAGTVLVLFPYFFRARLGRLGALFAAGILAIDPWMIACSGLADSSMLSWALGLVALSLLDRGARPGPSWLWLALLLLISGHQAWSIFPVLFLFVLVCRPELKIEEPLQISGLRLVRSLGGVLLTLGLLIQGQGLGPISTSLSIWFQQWMVNPGDDASSWSHLDLLAQQPLLILSGAVGLVLLWFKSPNQSTVDSRWRLFLTLWVSWGIILALSGTPPASLLALELALLFSAAHVWERVLNYCLSGLSIRRDLFSMGLLLLLAAASSLWILGIVSARTPWNPFSNLFGLVATVLICSLLLIRSGPTSSRALLLSVVLLCFGLAFSHSQAVKSGLSSWAAPGQTSSGVRTLIRDIQALSSHRAGDSRRIPLQVDGGPVPDPVLAWYLRDMIHLDWGRLPSESSYSGEVSPLLIAPSPPAGGDPRPPVGYEEYIGSRYQVRMAPSGTTAAAVQIEPSAFSGGYRPRFEVSVALWSRAYDP